MISGRDHKEIHASPEDAIALIQGHAYTVRYGKQCFGHFSTQRSAAYEASRQDAKAYKIERAPASRLGGSTKVILVPVEDLATVDTPAEDIARKIIEHIGATSGPVSPLAKQRVVALLHSTCPNKELSEEVFLVIYPASSKAQFDRLWDNIVTENEEKQPKQTEHRTAIKQPYHAGRYLVNNHSNNNQQTQSVKVKPVINVKTDREKLLDYAQVRGLEQITEAIITNNPNKCAELCLKSGIESGKFEELINYALNLGIIKEAQSESIKNLVLKHIARNSVERRINSDILSLINKNPRMAKMASAADFYGISQELMGSGYGKREADELAAEIVSLSKLLNIM